MSRTRPPDLQPIISEGARYEQNFNKPGILCAYDDKSRDKIWEMEIYHCTLVPYLETDVQAIYFKSMELMENGKALLIRNENNDQFRVDLEQRKVENLPVSVNLDLHKVEKIGQRRQVFVSLSVKNQCEAEFRLDGPSVAEGGSVRSEMFIVTFNGEPLQYKGIMSKRAAPERFIHLKKGCSFRSEIDIAEYYGFPTTGGELTIFYESFNHFSPDATNLRSNIVRFFLD